MDSWFGPLLWILRLDPGFGSFACILRLYPLFGCFIESFLWTLGLDRWFGSFLGSCLWILALGISLASFLTLDLWFGPFLGVCVFYLFYGTFLWYFLRFFLWILPSDPFFILSFSISYVRSFHAVGARVPTFVEHKKINTKKASYYYEICLGTAAVPHFSSAEVAFLPFIYTSSRCFSQRQ